jgi:hypothetical protein
MAVDVNLSDAGGSRLVDRKMLCRLRAGKILGAVCSFEIRANTHFTSIHHVSSRPRVK